MSNIKPIKINPELFKVSSNQNKNKTLKNKPNTPIKSNVLKKDLLARIKNHRSQKYSNLVKSNSQEIDNIDTTFNNSDNNNDNNNDTISQIKTTDATGNTNISRKQEIIDNPSKINNIPITVESNSNNSKKNVSKNDDDDDFLQSINFLKTLSDKKNNTMKRKNLQDFPIERQDTLDNKPEYGCLKNGSLPTFRQYHNTTVKKDFEPLSSNTSKIKTPNRKNVTFKYNLGKKHKVVSVLIKNVATRKNISNEHTRLKEVKLNDMKNYLKRHNLLKSGSNAPPDVIKKLYEQSLLSGDIRNTNKKSIVHNYLAE